MSFCCLLEEFLFANIVQKKSLCGENICRNGKQYSARIVLERERYREKVT